ncbi:hypothetical protein EVAR_46133_1 [Eumeta japonica]|uniref:Uncharacterized protein n=1 Tax=Eumeta variegata TaxID=151549 RepID=A0A4C1XNV0_EUMVA|nr:hypothetical protein EVAR_46133_1 [Eumeta japonica]
MAVSEATTALRSLAIEPERVNLAGSAKKVRLSYNPPLSGDARERVSSDGRNSVLFVRKLFRESKATRWYFTRSPRLTTRRCAGACGQPLAPLAVG